MFFFDMAVRERLEDAARRRRLIVTENSVPIEHLEYPSVTGAADPAAVHQQYVAVFARQLPLSHHFLWRAAIERATLIASLCAAGRLVPQDIARSRTLEHLVSLMPIGFGAASRAAVAATRPRHLAAFLWTGGIWSFYDPLIAVEAIALCRDRGVPATLAFLYASLQPDNAALIAAIAARIRDLNLTSQVTLRAAPLGPAERDAVLLGARASVCIGRPGAENETCVRLRIRDSRLYGLPWILDPYGATAAEASRDGLAHVLAEPSPHTLAAAMIEMLSATPGDRHPVADYQYDRTMREISL